MNIKQSIKKASFVILLAMGIQVVYGSFSFTGIADEKARNSKYTLRNLNALSHKGLSFSSLRSSLQYRGAKLNGTKESFSGIEVSSMLRFDNGNTAYLFPYKFNVKVSKFKTPSPAQR